MSHHVFLVTLDIMSFCAFEMIYDFFKLNLWVLFCFKSSTCLTIHYHPAVVLKDKNQPAFKVARVEFVDETLRLLKSRRWKGVLLFQKKSML